MSIQNYGGSDATKRESYKLRLQAISEEQKVDEPVWATPKINLILLFVFSTMDGMVLFNIFDTVFTQSAITGYVMAFGFAVILNVIPLIISRFIYQSIYKTKKHASKIAIMFIAIFFALFAATVFFRFAYRDMYDEEKQLTQLENTVSNEENLSNDNDDGNNSDKSLAVVFLLSLSPLATSLIGFGIAYISGDEIKKKVQFFQRRDIELDEAISDLEAAIATMNNNIKRDIDLDEQMMEAAIEEIIARCNILKAYARHYLAEYLANPSATTKLSQEMLLNGNNDINQGQANKNEMDSDINKSLIHIEETNNQVA